MIHDEKYDPKERPRVDDEEWIEFTSGEGLVIIKRDKEIRRRPAEKAAFVKHNSRAFLLGGHATRFQMLRHLMLSWERIHEAINTKRPPFIYFVDENGKIHERAL